LHRVPEAAVSLDGELGAGFRRDGPSIVGGCRPTLGPHTEASDETGSRGVHPGGDPDAGAGDHGVPPAGADPKGEIIELDGDVLGTVEVVVFSNGAPSPGLVVGSNQVAIPYQLGACDPASGGRPLGAARPVGGMWDRRRARR
jgi:hypothetical protein